MHGDLLNQIEAPAVLTIVAIVSIAVLTDVRRRRIYNAMTFPAMVLGLAINAGANGLAGLRFSVLGLLLGVLLFIVPVAFLGRGAGDLKLLAALGALGGPAFVFWTGLWSGVAGGLFALLVLLSRRNAGVVLAGFALDARAGHFPAARSNIRLPYAVPIAAGALLALTIV